LEQHVLSKGAKSLPATFNGSEQHFTCNFIELVSYVATSLFCSISSFSPVDLGAKKLTEPHFLHTMTLKRVGNQNSLFIYLFIFFAFFDRYKPVDSQKKI